MKVHSSAQVPSVLIQVFSDSPMVRLPLVDFLGEPHLF